MSGIAPYTKSVKGQQGPEDLNQVAFRIMSEAVGDVPKVEREKNAAAVELGRLGGLKGGKARAEKMTPEERSNVAKAAARARWAKQG